MEQYYLQQINDKVELIRADVDQNSEIIPVISTNLFNIKESTQELVSGDKLILEQLEATNNNITMLAMILLMMLLFNFIMRCFK